MTALLADGNVLVALTVADHVHHEVAMDWFGQTRPDLATCPITQGTLLRFLIREGASVDAAIAVLEALRATPWHRFWADDIPYESGHLAGVIGHRQVTDAYLVALAAHHGSKVATLDRGLAILHPAHVYLLEPL
ncbi:MAG: TA system VapC family ribonuclease toxin [Microthrixaceae bacterium]